MLYDFFVVVENWPFESNNVVTPDIRFSPFQHLLFLLLLFFVFVFLIDVGYLWLRINLKYQLKAFSEPFSGYAWSLSNFSSI